MKWDFSKLPKSEYNNAIKYYENGMYVEMLRLHNKYKLSSNHYCCNFNNIVSSWFKWAINRKKIWEINEN